MTHAQANDIGDRTQATCALSSGTARRGRVPACITQDGASFLVPGPIVQPREGLSVPSSWSGRLHRTARPRSRAL